MGDRTSSPRRTWARSSPACERINEIQRLLIDQIDVLETMTPLDFLDFRDVLIPASGFQSVQFRLIENRLGLDPRHRLKIKGMPYTGVLREEHARAAARTPRHEPSLLDHLERWLERTPFLSFGELRLLEAYREAVERDADAEPGGRRDPPALDAEERAAAAGPSSTPPWPASTRCSTRRYGSRCVSQGKRRLTHRAFLAALLINLYRDEPIFELPFRFLTALVDIDEGFTDLAAAPRADGPPHDRRPHRHRRHQRATSTCRPPPERHRVFTDLFDLPTFFIPRSALPPLPDEVAEQMGFRYRGRRRDRLDRRTSRGSSASQPGRLHVAAHSHHPWPDVTLDAQQQAWLRRRPPARRQVGRGLRRRACPRRSATSPRRLGLPDPATIAFAPNTHELRAAAAVVPAHAGARAHHRRRVPQLRPPGRPAGGGRAGRGRAGRAPSRSTRSRSAWSRPPRPRRPRPRLLRHVLFDSGFVVPDVGRDRGRRAGRRARSSWSTATTASWRCPTDLSADRGPRLLPRRRLQVRDGGRGGLLPALPARLRRAPARHRLVRGVRRAGGRPRPASPTRRTAAGSSAPPSTRPGLYRFNAVQRWLDDLGWDVAAHPRPRPRAAGALPGRPARRAPGARASCSPDRDEVADRGNFLTFRPPLAGALQARLAAGRIVATTAATGSASASASTTTASDVDELLRRVERAVAA